VSRARSGRWSPRRQLDRHVTAPVAAVAEQDDVAAVAQRAEEAAQVAPADEEDVLLGALGGQVVVQRP
jgi:hypothetical protein